ncbi:N-acetylmuramoyl-L-alanine amidase [Carnobacterium maltaromaticum]|uniref:peptidoglycan recognition protein family protein n=1 Tax=Carnobacterium maltaromaticum TaxID=2751 RepID=UPI0039AF7D26
MNYKIDIVNAQTNSLKPLGAVIHNDAGSMTPFQYIEWLKGRDLELGFAHFYINRNENYQAMETNRVAWHCGNSWGNGNLLSYEVCESFSASDTDFLANEEAVFQQVAKDFKLYAITPNRDTVRLHKEFFNTACPHRSWDLHGKELNAVKDYFISRVAHYMGLIKPETIIPVGGISVGTNIYANFGSLVDSSVKPSPGPIGPVNSAWVTDFIPGRPSPYEISRDGKVAGYTARANISRVNQLPANSIPEGSNVTCYRNSVSADRTALNPTGYQTYWVAQYLDGGKKAPYRLVKNGMTAGFADRDNIQLVN